MTLSALIFLTLDGVYQGPGRVDEDRRDGFDRGGWAGLHPDPEAFAFISDVYGRADALLLGRRTWDIWAPYWPLHDDVPLGHRINTLPKYVPSSTLRDPAWGPTVVLDGDVEGSVRELKARPGEELQVHGSGVLLRWLLERSLVDELHVITHPVILGAGRRLFPERGPMQDLIVTASTSTPAGLVIQTLRPAGAEG